MPLNIGIDVVLPPGMATLENFDPVAALHETAPTIGNAVNESIRNRTPILTGALFSSETFETPGSGATIASFYADDGPQLDAWGRVYVQYQEGPPLGESTYTNGPHNMYGLVETEDSVVIQAWAESTLESKLNVGS